jgi:hypothetical protein
VVEGASNRTVLDIRSALCGAKARYRAAFLEHGQLMTVTTGTMDSTGRGFRTSAQQHRPCEKSRRLPNCFKMPVSP